VVENVSILILEMLAELPQMPKHSFFDLRNFRKPLKVVFRFAELPRGISKSAEGA